MTSALRTFCQLQRFYSRITQTRESPMCAAFKEYEEVPEMEPLDFMKDGVMWVASKLSGAAGTLEAEAVELRKWIIFFGCTL